MTQEGAAAADPWTLAVGKEEERPLLFRFRQQVPAGIATSDYPTLINIYWRCDETADNGMPSSADSERQDAFEEAIAPLDEAEQLGFLMLVITGNSRKEWIHYVGNTAVWLDRLNELLAGHDVYPIEIETNTDADWRTWCDLVAAIDRADS